jgi:hypothetical protein
MALPARFSLLHSDLNDFLFATVGEQQNGMPLNVVSGLTRLGLDPWEEAGRLAVLPKALAAEKLAPIIARLPLERPESLDNLAISRLLVELLPEHRRAASPDPQQCDAKGKKYIQAMVVLSCLALGAAVLFSML